ncbi:4'-phosphopantetheinyl transferase family protein [Halomonas caseinilytica]|uniref:4'-phosphopantetheinyl transferase family protein n=1 Tax=Halomonas caseinilytica TaxID=438744 RepID=UPI0008C13068|nr:phosphopantetheine--protein transferase domain-containing protein [Halomonas caseinilytica]
MKPTLIDSFWLCWDCCARSQEVVRRQRPCPEHITHQTRALKPTYQHRSLYRQIQCGRYAQLGRLSDYRYRSHSGNHSIFVRSGAARFGVDFEVHRDGIDLQRISERYFSDRELDSLSSVGKSDMADQFYVLWTAKEACLKAMEVGLFLGLSAASVQRVDVVCRSLLGRWHLVTFSDRPCRVWCYQQAGEYTVAFAMWK